MEELQNNFTKGKDDFLDKTMEEYSLLVNYKTTQSNTEKRLVENSEEVLFTNIGGSKGKSHPYKRDRCGIDRGERNVWLY